MSLNSYECYCSYCLATKRPILALKGLGLAMPHAFVRPCLHEPGEVFILKVSSYCFIEKIAVYTSRGQLCCVVKSQPRAAL